MQLLCTPLEKTVSLDDWRLHRKEIRSEFPNSIRISKYQAAISELEDGKCG